LQQHFSINDRVGIVLDFTRFDIDGIDADMTSLGVQFSLGK